MDRNLPLRPRYPHHTRSCHDPPNPLSPNRPTPGGGGFGRAQRPQKDPNREVPLAVYGPLVEFEGRLHTVAVADRIRAGQAARWLGATAIEARKNVWYQAKLRRAKAQRHVPGQGVPAGVRRRPAGQGRGAQ